MTRKALPGVLLVLCSPLTLLAHDGSDQKAPFPKPSFSGQGQVNFTSNGVQLMGWVPVSDFDPTFGSGNDCWGYTSPSGREYAIMGLNAGTGWVEVTDPGSPSMVAVHPGPNSTWHDIKCYAEHAYVVSEGGMGIQVYDMSNIDSGVVTHVGDFGGGGCTDQSHNVAINEDSGFLYRTGGSGSPCPGGPQGLVFYDLSNPASPSFVGSWEDRYVHDAQVVTWDIAGPHFGKELAFCAAETSSGGGSPSLHIVDVSNKASPTVLGSLTYSNSAFSHQLWLSEDKTTVYQNDELDESNFGFSTRTRIMNVTNLTNPTVSGFFTTGTPAIDHNLYVHNNRIYEANYRSGLRIFDNTNPLSPVEVAWFDTYPADDDTAFNSLWSNYPFFPSGTVIGSDREKGLMIFYVGNAKLSFAFPEGTPIQVPVEGRAIRFVISEETPGDLQPGTASFHYDSGSGFQTLAATSLGGALYEAILPSAPCGTTVDYYISAQSTDGLTWSDPPAGPTQVYSALAAAFVQQIFEDDIEPDLGWSVGAVGDDAATGIWERVDPLGTAAQPEDDHTPVGTICWVTGQGTGGSVGENDVDGGTTTLLSASMDGSGLFDPYLSYWRWFSNNQNSAVDDVFVIDISSNGGASWTNLETIGPGGADAVGGWIRHTVRIADFITPTNQIRLRFIASDLNSGSIVECAIDDLVIEDLICNVGIASVTPDTGSTNARPFVTITGEGFLAGETTVSFGAQAATSVNVVSSTSLTCRVPARAGGGGGRLGHSPRAVDVRVTTGVDTATLPRAYTYTLPVR